MGEHSLRIRDYPAKVPHKSYYSTDELAVILSLSRESTRRLIEEGAFELHQLAGRKKRYRVSIESIKEYARAPGAKRTWILQRIDWDNPE